MSGNIKNCFCLVTHKYDVFVREHWLKILDDLRGTSTNPILLCDITGENKNEILKSVESDIERGLFTREKVFTFNEENVREYLESRRYVIKYYEPSGRLFYGNIMLAYMYFFLSHQSYDYYWFKEYDVDYTGSWRHLIEKYSSVDDDFLSRSSEVGNEYNKDWYHYGEWVTKTIPPFEDSEVIVTFNPITRFSYKALEYLDELYRGGNSGFYELFLGTVLKRGSFKLGGFREYGDLDIEGFTYIPNSGELPKSVVIEPDKLYHPVKTSRISRTVKSLGQVWRDKFDHVYCVSFAPYKDRRKKMYDEMRRVHIIDNDLDKDSDRPFFSVHYTVDNKFEQMLLNWPEFKYPRHNMRFNKGALNLAIGHYCVMKEALALGYKRILIVEDDIAFLKDLDKISEILENMPLTDVVMFDKVAANRKAWEYDRLNKLTSGGHYVHLSEVDVLWTTSCYSVNVTAMRHIISSQETMLNVADYYTNAFLATEGYSMVVGKTGVTRSASVTNLACQRPSEETISDHGSTNSVYNQNGLYGCGINLGNYNI